MIQQERSLAGGSTEEVPSLLLEICLLFSMSIAMHE